MHIYKKSTMYKTKECILWQITINQLHCYIRNCPIHELLIGKINIPGKHTVPLSFLMSSVTLARY